MVLGKLPVPGRPTVSMIIGQGPTVLAVGAGGCCLDIFTLIYPFFPLSPSLWETARYRLKYCLKRPLNPKPTNLRKTATIVQDQKKALARPCENNPGPEVINLLSCSAQPSMNFFLLINVKLPTTIIGILIFMNRKNSVLSLSEPE